MGPMRARVLLSPLLVLCGCVARVEPSLDAADPVARLHAIAGLDDPGPGELAGLVAALGSDDGAVRVLAIARLERHTGERFGYDPSADPARRREAIARWEAWLRERALVGGDGRGSGVGGAREGAVR